MLEIEDAIVCSPVVRYTLTHRSENSDTSLGFMDGKRSRNPKYSTQYETEIDAMVGQNKSTRPV